MKMNFPPLHLQRGPFELSLQSLPLPVVVDGVSVWQWTWGHGESPFNGIGDLGTRWHGDSVTPWSPCTMDNPPVWQGSLCDNWTMFEGVTLWHGDMGIPWSPWHNPPGWRGSSQWYKLLLQLLQAATRSLKCFCYSFHQNQLYVAVDIIYAQMIIKCSNSNSEVPSFQHLSINEIIYFGYSMPDTQNLTPLSNSNFTSADAQL